MIRNLTGREIVIYDDKRRPQTWIPRDEESINTEDAITGKMIVDKVDGIPVVEMVLGKVNLPEPEEDTFLVCTRVVAEAAAAQGRTTSDLLVPSSPIRDREDENDDGSSIILGWRQLARLPR